MARLDGRKWKELRIVIEIERVVRQPVQRMLFLSMILFTYYDSVAAETKTGNQFRLASFRADVTIPIGHRCMGVLPTKSKTIRDRLYANGFILTGAQQPIVLCAVDWCEIRNGAYDQWRDALASSVGTTRERVLVCSLHQHDAPVIDTEAAKLLSEVGLEGELYDVAFHDRIVARVARAASDELENAIAITHLGIGQARVDRIASNRRVVLKNGTITFGRSSRSANNEEYSTAPDGEIDPFLKTISFWQDDQPILALHAYATHPMSYYGFGEVSSDFVGLARDQRQRDDFSVRQIYVSGCSGDVTAGKYNDGTVESRLTLTRRLYQAMVAAWKNTKRTPLTRVAFRNSKLELDFHHDVSLTESALVTELGKTSNKVESRILAAMGLSSRRRVGRGQLIDVPCIDFGQASIILFPGESFVGYQRMAQEMTPNSFVLAIGYGECWPGYVPTEAAFRDSFRDKWLWVAPGSETRLKRAMRDVLLP